MKDEQRTPESPGAAAHIGEMMLAKTVLEEKNELLDRKDELIRAYRAGELQMRSELERLREELDRCRAELDSRCDVGRREGARRVVAEVLHISADYDDCPDSAAADLARRLVILFQRGYGLEVLAEAPARIDPALHRVVEVGFHQAEEQVFQVLSKGYRLDRCVIRPMMLRVLRGTFGSSAGRERTDHSQC